MLPRENYERIERQILCEAACLSTQTRGRERPLRPCDLRTEFQRDRDKIIHCNSFRRLKSKTQVFLSPEGDHYRTRLTHTLEVGQIARTIARAMSLNEDLTEAIAMGHDLGHTPFGHAGERALDRISPNGFKHYEQGVRVVRFIENDGRGLNLTYEVRDGILKHTNGIAETKEGLVVRFADVIAYLNHDIDDAIRANILRESDIPDEITEVLGHSKSERITTLVTDLISNGVYRMEYSSGIDRAYRALKDFMFDRVYRNPSCKSEEKKIYSMFCGLYDHYYKNINELPDVYKMLAERDGKETAVCDYIAGMSDKYAADEYVKIFIPAAWSKR
ncbi:MAG: deoxyguanosinetriphosphate triphosphohydrolase [Ruminococcus sp.]|nr:deoxyguanosinetriphosphate triphosphohydrolase [Ruminococcus sp.]